MTFIKALGEEDEISLELCCDKLKISFTANKLNNKESEISTTKKLQKCDIVLRLIPRLKYSYALCEMNMVYSNRVWLPCSMSARRQEAIGQRAVV